MSAPTNPLLCRLPEPPRGPCLEVPLQLTIPANTVASEQVAMEYKYNGRDGAYHVCSVGFVGDQLGFQFRDSNGENLSSGYLRPGSNTGRLVFQPALRLPPGGNIGVEIRSFNALAESTYQIQYRGFKTYHQEQQMNPYASPVEQGVPDFDLPRGQRPGFYVHVVDIGDLAASQILLNQPFQITGGDFIWKLWSTTSDFVALRFTDGENNWRMNERILTPLLTFNNSNQGVPLFPELRIRDRRTIYFDIENTDSVSPVEDFQIWLIGERILA